MGVFQSRLANARSGVQAEGTSWTLTSVRWRRSCCADEAPKVEEAKRNVLPEVSSCAIIELDSLIVVDSNLIANSKPLNFQLSS